MRLPARPAVPGDCANRGSRRPPGRGRQWVLPAAVQAETLFATGFSHIENNQRGCRLISIGSGRLRCRAIRLDDDLIRPEKELSFFCQVPISFDTHSDVTCRAGGYTCCDKAVVTQG